LLTSTVDKGADEVLHRCLFVLTSTVVYIGKIEYCLHLQQIRGLMKYNNSLRVCDFICCRSEQWWSKTKW